ncbi:MAG: DUF523 and DUF1722 domain-containing protein [Gammaproteobacteria bacterium]|nr:DUF523 and DUF1722 domain-containing protein [Gammaproteobacteria bacterium]MDH3465163.1 DUF523 and DUF1722 domain-containing protein [Gammaproteobacteria bacterium]
MSFKKTTSRPGYTIPVGISGCLLGDEVRHDGGHRRSKLCLGTFSDFFEYRRFCPEVAAGFGTPRPTMRLVGDPGNPRLRLSDHSGEDLTDQVVSGFSGQLETWSHLDGYILMKNSPSCGMTGIKIYRENGYPLEQRGRGLFAEALLKKYPFLPVEEEGRLNDHVLRENFVMRVYVHYNFRHEVRRQPSYHNLLQFHSSYKYLLMAHNQQAYRELGQLLAVSGKEPLPELLDEYQFRFTKAVSKPAKRGSQSNAMQHILGYLSRTVSSEERLGILDVIAQYHRAEVNLATPLTLLNHYIQRAGNDYVRAQRYLEPYPAAMGLRNQV